MSIQFSTRKSLSRRTFLRGAGAALGLPLLDAMTPAFARAAEKAESPKRFVAACATLGFHTPFLFPTQAGDKYTPTPYLETLKANRNQLTVFSGVSHPNQSGANGHTSELTWLTSATRPGLPGFKNTISLDQFLADKLGPRTRYSSLVLTSGQGNDSLSWTSNGVQIPAESSPARLFAQLFIDGTPDQVKTRMRAIKRGQSILDAVASEAKKLDRTLGPADRRKMDEYLSAVRELEGRMKESEAWTNKPKPRVDAKPPTDIQNRNDAIGRTKLMNEMIVLALQTDSTRIATCRLSSGGTPIVEGVTNEWHSLSHHGQDPAKIEELKKIELAEFQALADFLGRLKSIKEGDATLLDRTAVLYGSNLGNASSHDWRNLPLVLAGGGFSHGKHLAFDPKNNLPFSNLFVSLARWMGAHDVARFGSSTATSVPGLDVKG